MSERKGLNRQLFWLYEGNGRAPYAFRWAMLVFDFVTIAYFLWTPFEARTGHEWIDYLIGGVIALDLLARFYIARSKRRFATRVMNWADFVVVITMFAPLFTANLAFLRVLRAVRAIRAFTFIKRAGGVWRFVAQHEKLIDRVTNLIVFVFVMAAFVYVSQVGHPKSGIHSYLDALYFTLASLTTTGYGDIVMVGTAGKVIAIAIMVLGLTLFLRLLKEILRPGDKVEAECETCGLNRHDPDAIHCRHCGATMHIVTGGQN